ncbi:MAG: CBS domain-containing protein, partial [Nitrospira sp.]|nr:CBS domain-containing protein [Nitrospira sp.]
MTTQYGVNALPVVDTQETFLSLATREAVQKGLYHKLGAQPVEHIMLRDIFCATPTTAFEDVQHQMVERNQRIVPVIDQKQVIGIFSRTDLLRVLHQGPIIETEPAALKTEAIPSTSMPLHTWNVTHLLTNRLPP